jgi:hypothetical protein
MKPNLEGLIMKALLVPLLLLALSAPALAQFGLIRPAPGPVMGAGLLPVLLVGGGIYWLMRRKKTTSS